ncbi:MAG: STAS domain-containing protein [Myxococcales bacterium]|nr:STAS domain-containing protein [Myxococcales bacterium]
MPEYPQLSTLSLMSILDDILEVCFVYRDDGVLMDMNRTCEEFTRVPRSAVINNFNLFDNKEILDPTLWEGYQRAFAGTPQRVPATQIRVPRQTDEGTVQGDWVETLLVPLLVREDGTAPYVLGIQRVITELMRTREEVYEAKAEIDFQRDTIASLEAAHKEIESQRATIEALATPVIEVWEGVLTLPLLGHYNAERAGRMSAQLLDAVANTGARHVILDLTGLAAVDTATGELLLRIISTVKLLGAIGVLVGIQTDVAQTLVALGVPLERISVQRNLREALKAIMRERGQLTDAR